MTVFENDFRELVSQYAGSPAMADVYWSEIKTLYQCSNRYYHNLQHPDTMYRQLLAVKDQLSDWPAIVFSIAYHDLVYNTYRNDNEEKSAAVATERLAAIHCPPQKIQRCRQHILATSGHTVSDDSDTNFFTDADLSILGAGPAEYSLYAEHIRKEYNQYPGFLYRRGRRKVLNSFLSRKTIFKTAHFSRLYEQQARKNLIHELQALG